MEMTDLLELFKRPELLSVQFLVLKAIGAFCSALLSVALYQIKKLISEVRKSTHVNSRLAYKMETLTNRLTVHEENQKDIYEELSRRVHKLELSMGIIEREVLKKTGHNENIF